MIECSNPTVNLVVFQVISAPNLQVKESNFSLLSLKFSKEVKSKLLFDFKPNKFHLTVYLVKVFALATAFQEFTFIVKYCPLTSAFGECSLSGRERFLWYSKHMSIRKDALKSEFQIRGGIEDNSRIIFLISQRFLWYSKHMSIRKDALKSEF